MKEQKFLRGCRKVGHTEDVVTDEQFRRRGLVKKIINCLLGEAKRDGKVYKVILDCTDENSAVYGKIGFFKTGEIQMRVDVV